ncbi:MAG TPA: hypothetical protein VMI54_30930 [Polyangiaceae bacterium]|nr:hypothetical protein [Polyangiaceae bacterium]
MARPRSTAFVALVAWTAFASACSSSSPAVNGAGTANGYAGTAGSAGGSVTGGTASTVDGSGGAASTADGSGGTMSDAGAPGAEPPYANVTAVAADGTDGDYTFNVTVESADIDCSQYADWWEVLGEDGSLIYRRILEHSHTDANGTSDPDAPGNTFTRSGGPVPVASSDVVLVRAHMSVGGYNGEVMRGTVDGGFTNAPDIDADFAAGVANEDPQPDGCEF